MTNTKFADLPISEEILRALTELGYEAPTPIQAETLPLLLAGDTDYLGLAATGTGKTAAFSIPLLERLDPETPEVQALVLCPTRELAIQVAGQIDLLGKYKGIRALPIYGGTGYGDQIKGLRGGATVVVGTPGRVVDHIEKGYLRLDNLRTLVLDEADEMISMGFKEDLETVLGAAPKGQANIWLFSATMGADVKHVADAYLEDPQRVQINKTEVLSNTVEQIFYKTHEYDKPDLLCRLVDIADDFYGIVFCQTKALVADLHQLLLSRGYRVDCLHGDLDQGARDRVMKSFRDRNISILVATDVACRGLDVKDVTHVVNYSIPRELDNYVHRIGRTARSGKQGLAISFVTFSHRELIGRIERMTKSTMKEGVMPTQKDILLKRINKVRTAFETRGAQGRATSMLPEEWKTALGELTQADIAGRFLALMLNDAFEDKKAEKAPESKATAPARAPREHAGTRDRSASREPRREEGNFRPKFAGKKDFHPRKPAFDRKRAWGGGDRAEPRREGGFRADSRSSAPEFRKASHFSKPTPMGGPASASDKVKKKPFGHWKPKKTKPAPTFN